MRSKSSLIAFDLDGTLVDSAPDLAHAVDYALERAGLARAGEELTRNWIGGGVEKLVLRALQHTLAAEPARALFDSAFADFSSHYIENLFVDSRLYPGIETTLDTLAVRDLALGCITNKRSIYAERLLRQAGIRDHFSILFGGDSFEQKKPHPRQLLEAAARIGTTPERSLLVGDSRTDLDAAAAAGFDFVWVSYGYGKLDQADLVKIDYLPELLEIL